LVSFGFGVTFWWRAFFGGGPITHGSILGGGSQSGTPSYK